MTVLDNVMYALDLKLKDKEEAKKQATRQEEIENINADSIRKDMNREFID